MKSYAIALAIPAIAALGGASQLALVADHCGPISLSWAWAFWTMRLRIVRGEIF